MGVRLRMNLGSPLDGDRFRSSDAPARRRPAGVSESAALSWQSVAATCCEPPGKSAAMTRHCMSTRAQAWSDGHRFFLGPAPAHSRKKNIAVRASARGKLIKIGAKVVCHGRYVALFAAHRGTAATAITGAIVGSPKAMHPGGKPTGGVRPNAKEIGQISPSKPPSYLWLLASSE
jgi:hypothetical protein